MCIEGVLSKGQSLWGCPGATSPGKILKFGPLRMHFVHPRALIRIFEHNIIKFWLFYVERVHEDSKLLKFS